MQADRKSIPRYSRSTGWRSSATGLWTMGFTAVWQSH